MEPIQKGSDVRKHVGRKYWRNLGDLAFEGADMYTTLLILSPYYMG